jgi:hypothetical protein
MLEISTVELGTRNAVRGGIILSKPGGLDLSRCRHWQKVNLDSFKKLVLTIDKSRSRYLNFVSTPPSSPKSLDQEIRNPSRPDIFGKSRQFVSISIEN